MPSKSNRGFTRQVGERIRLLRERAGLSLEDVAWEIGIHKGHLSRIERGERTPSLPLLVSLAKQMNVLVTDFVAVGDDARSRLIRALFGVEASVLERILEQLPRTR